jgi:arylsulfatase A-like enzyme
MPPADRPNVVVVFSDQHRGQAMGCAGNPDAVTPAMDRLADEGTRFANATANAPVCVPSRAALLTGQYPWTNGIDRGLPLSTDVTSVAEVFRDAGYRTGYVGKWHLDDGSRDSVTPPGPRRQGFDDFWAAYNCNHEYLDAAYYRDDDPEPVPIDGYEPVTQTDLALEFLRRDDERPACLFLAYGPPHDPYPRLPAAYADRYDPDDLTLRPNVESTSPGHTIAANLARGVNTRDILQEPDRDVEPMTPPEVYANYYAHVTAVDEQLGRLLDDLDDRGVADETVVAYTADHGDMLWSHGRVEKSVPYAEAASVPFLLRYPGRVPEGRVSDALLSTVDVAPTLLSLAGLDVPAAMQGTDCSAVAAGGPDGDGPDAAYLCGSTTSHWPTDRESDSAWRAVRTSRYTYARLSNGHPWLCFDDEADPYQFHNRVYESAFADRQAALDALLDDWRERTDDPFPAG